MSTEENKAIVRRLGEALNQRTLDVLEEIVDADCPWDSRQPGSPTGPEAFRQVAEATIAAFPDIHYDTVEIVAEGDKVMELWMQTGTMKGPLADGTPPTGKTSKVDGFSYLRIANGKVVEHSATFDQLDHFQQLGITSKIG